MARKHKSNRRQKITQSNIPKPFVEEKKQAEQTLATLPENTHSENPAENENENAAEKHIENDVVASSAVAAVEDSPYQSLDSHYAQQENNTQNPQENHQDKQENDDDEYAVLHDNHTENSPETVSGSLNASENATVAPENAASLAEYEQLKGKNRRRLIGAGALVLVAGSLFAAASKDTTPSPQLATMKPAEQSVQTEILRPAGSENKIDLSMDDTNTKPLVLKGNAMAAHQPSENKTKTKTVTTPLPQPKPITQSNNSNATTVSANAKPNNSANSGSSANTVSNDDKQKAEERRKIAQSKAAEAEAKRLAAERAVVNNVKAAQANAERSRNAERAQLTVERAAEEKQRAQRQANERNERTSSKSSGNGIKAVQAGAFSDRKAAHRMQQQLRDMNVSARVEEVQTSKGKIYRVRTGNFSSDAEARSTLNKLQNKGVNGMVVGK